MAATGNTTIQLAVPDQLRGRVMSVYTTVFSASVPIGGLAMGAVASAFGVGRDRARRGADGSSGSGRWPGVAAALRCGAGGPSRVGGTFRRRATR